MYILNKIECYPKKTLEQSLKDVMKSRNKMISGKFSPVVYGLKYFEVAYKSEDGVNLYGWLIKRGNAQKTIMLIHGRNNNRIFCLKFLQLILDIDKEEKYNIFIPDLRNSGKSDTTRTAFGYFFARDIYSSMKYLKENYLMNNFILYGFSQGAMGAAASLYFYKENIKKYNLKVEKLILDSPVSNVREIILKNAKIFGKRLPYLFMMPSLYKFNKHIDNNLSNMALSKLLGIVPSLILQSEKDAVTPYEIVLNEYEKLKKYENLEETKFKAFRKGQHVRIYLEYKEEYTQTINKFLESEII